MIRTLLNAGAEIEARDNDGASPLLAAARYRLDGIEAYRQLEKVAQ